MLNIASSMTSLETFMPMDLQVIFKEHLGPNWMFHIEEELKARNPDYAFFDEFPDHMREERALEIAFFIRDLKNDITSGKNIVCPETLRALYNWKPGFLICHTLEKHPDWKIYSASRGGGACVVSIHNPKYSPFSGVLIAHDTFEEREAAWHTEVNKMITDMREKNWICASCMDEKIKKYNYVPPRPKLTRENAAPIKFCHEVYKIRCPECSRKCTMHINFSG